MARWGKDKAQRALQASKSEAVPAANNHSLEALAARFLSEADLAEVSRKQYARALRPFLGWTRKHGLELPDIAHRDLIAYKRHIQEEKKLAAHTLQNYLVAVRRLFSWLESSKIFPNLAANNLRVRRPSKNFAKDALTVEQARELLGSVSGESLEELRDKALLRLLVATGLRSIEAHRADVGDIRQLAGKSVLHVQGKGRLSKDEFVVLTADTLEPLMAYLTKRGSLAESAPLFASIGDSNRGARISTRSIRRIVKNRFRAVKLESPRITTHSLRHTAVTFALIGGSTLQQAQQLARHADINTSLIYAHNLDRASGIAEANIEALLKQEAA